MMEELDFRVFGLRSIFHTSTLQIPMSACESDLSNALLFFYIVRINCHHMILTKWLLNIFKINIEYQNYFEQVSIIVYIICNNSYLFLKFKKTCSTNIFQLYNGFKKYLCKNERCRLMFNDYNIWYVTLFVTIEK